MNGVDGNLQYFHHGEMFLRNRFLEIRHKKINKNYDKSKLGSFSDTFYFIDSQNSDIHIFYNLSNATDDIIIEMMKRAYNISDMVRTKTICQDIFGKKIGYIT